MTHKTHHTIAYTRQWRGTSHRKETGKKLLVENDRKRDRKQFKTGVKERKRKE